MFNGVCLLMFQSLRERLRLAIIGQSSFASEVYKSLRSEGHHVVGVFTVPDTGAREDPIGEQVYTHTHTHMPALLSPLVERLTTLSGLHFTLLV